MKQRKNSSELKKRKKVIDLKGLEPEEVISKKETTKSVKIVDEEVKDTKKKTS